MTTLHPGQTVSIGEPLRLDGHGWPRLGRVVRLNRKPWGDGADITRASDDDPSTGWGTTWIDARNLHPVDDDTYRRWLALRETTLHVAQAGRRTLAGGEQRGVDRACLLVATHHVLLERWRRNGLYGEAS